MATTKLIPMHVITKQGPGGSVQSPANGVEGRWP